MQLIHRKPAKKYCGGVATVSATPAIKSTARIPVIAYEPWGLPQKDAKNRKKSPGYTVMRKTAYLEGCV